MIQYGIISAFVIIYLSVNIQNLHSGACFRFSVLQGNRVLEWSWIRKLFEDPNPTLMKSSAKQGTESEAISSTTTCFFPFMDPAWIIGQPWRVHPIHPHQWVHKRQAFVAPRSCLDFRPGRECSHRVVGEVQDIPVLGWPCTNIFSIFFEISRHVSTTCNLSIPIPMLHILHEVAWHLSSLARRFTWHLQLQHRCRGGDLRSHRHSVGLRGAEG